MSVSKFDTKGLGGLFYDAGTAVMRFLFVHPSWGGAFAIDLDTAQQILASLAAYGASVPGSRPS